MTAHVSDGVVATVELLWAGTPLRTHLVAGRGLDREIAKKQRELGQIRTGRKSSLTALIQVEAAQSWVPSAN